MPKLTEALDSERNQNVMQKGGKKVKIGIAEINACPYCEGTDFRYGYQSGNSRLDGAPGFLDNQEPIHYLVCAQCGAIVFSWVTNPRKYSKNVPEAAK